MTVVTSETRLIGSGATTLPRVNLLPPEIAEKAAFRKVQYALGGAVLASLGVVGLLYVSAAHGVSEAKASLATAQQQTATLHSETAKYASVSATYQAAEAAQVQLTSAMGDEVRYSRLMNDLSLSVPSGIWLKSLVFAQTPTTNAAPGSTPGIGLMTVSGVAFSHDDVALWLESITGQKSYSDSYFSSSAEVLIGQRPVVDFSSTATVSPLAESGRYNKPIGG